jgi:thiamine pyrophosphokinase
LRAVVFANGLFSAPQAAQAAIRPEDLVIAADGGYRHLRALGLAPDVAIGDFDSLEAADLESLAAEGAEIIRHPAHKDFTDLELALRLAHERGAAEILVYGALGARWDQTLANLLLPAAAGLQEARIVLVDGPQEIHLVRSGETFRVRGRPGDTLSLVPLGGNAAGVTTGGLEYPLRGETLYFGATRGISNVFLEETASVQLESGTLLCVVIHKALEDPL